MQTQSLERICRVVLLSLLVLVHCVLLAAVVLADGDVIRLPAATGFLVTASQAALLAWLLVSGPGRWFWRMPLALACLGALMFAATWLSSTTLLPLLAVQAGLIAVVLAVLRVWGVRSGLETAFAGGRGAQYSVRTLLLFTSAAAVALFVVKTVRAQVGPQTTVPSALAVCSMGAALAAVSLAALWAVLPPSAPWLRLGVVAVLAPICGAAPAYVCVRDSDIRVFAAAALSHAVALCGSLLIVRLSGYRLGRRQRSPMPSRKTTKRPASAPWAAQLSGEPL